jgi:hypothetical protein
MLIGLIERSIIELTSAGYHGKHICPLFNLSRFFLELQRMLVVERCYKFVSMLLNSTAATPRDVVVNGCSIIALNTPEALLKLVETMAAGLRSGVVVGEALH